MPSFPRPGRVHWIGLRPAKRAPVVGVDTARARTGEGLDGDHDGGRSGNRGITLVQAEHLDVIASLTGVEKVAPATLRRNLVVSGINLAALKGRRFRIGEVVLEGTGRAHPCSRMEEALGPGGYNAMRGPMVGSVLVFCAAGSCASAMPSPPRASFHAVDATRCPCRDRRCAALPRRSAGIRSC